MERHENETMQDYAEKIKYLYDYIENKELKINQLEYQFGKLDNDGVLYNYVNSVKIKIKLIFFLKKINIELNLKKKN